MNNLYNCELTFGETGCFVGWDELGKQVEILENDWQVEDDDVLDWDDYDELSF